LTALASLTKTRLLKSIAFKTNYLERPKTAMRIARKRLGLASRITGKLLRRIQRCGSRPQFVAQWSAGVRVLVPERCALLCKSLCQPGKLQQTQRRRMSGMQMAQAAGAAISGGIFGGPEGFLGGAIGGITGGVGGAFVGAAAGAQVGMLRQQLGGFADYAAQIQKMEIALKNAAGSQDQFNQAVAAANSAVRNLNVPQDVAIQGMTRLTAAVKGAGGQVSDAELVFKNVTSAIKATGGSAEDVDGAITAMVQVFSKGKVSAEELSGQLGERLPGAVTKFAKANDMTLPELQKALEQGQVGLNELMNFIVQLGDEYSGVAQQIADSSQDAGARLTVAFNDMRIAVGEALQPIGAEFQEAFIPFIESITPVLVDILPKIGDFALAVAKNLDVLAAAAVGAGLAMGALSVASIKVAGTAGLSALGVAMLKATAAAGALTGALKALSVTALLNPWVALAAGIAAATVAIIKHSQAQKEYNNLLDNGAGSSNELRSTQRDLEAQITAARKALEGSADGMGAAGRRAMQLKMKIAELENQLARINKTFTVRLKLEREGFEFDESGQAKSYTVAGVTYDVKTGRPISGTQTPSQFPRLAEDGSGSSKAKKERESQLPQLQAQLAVQQQIAQINAKIRDAQLAENQFLQIRLEGERELAQIAGEIKALAFEKIPANEIEEKRKLLMLKADEARLDIALRLQQAEKQNLIEITQQSDNLAESYTTQIEDRQRLQELIATGMKEALALEYIQIENILKIEKERLEVRKALLEAAGDVGGAQETQDLIDRLGGKETGLKGSCCWRAGNRKRKAPAVYRASRSGTEGSRGACCSYIAKHWQCNRQFTCEWPYWVDRGHDYRQTDICRFPEGRWSDLDPRGRQDDRDLHCHWYCKDICWTGFWW
jgi:tape measure domain-containing protein